MPVEPEQLKRRELVVRVATLELLVADLIHLLRQVAPDKVDKLLEEAVVDRDTQITREMPAGAENQRYQLHQVFEERCRRLKHKRYALPHPRRPSEPTD
jgi:hypothetical protein